MAFQGVQQPDLIGLALNLMQMRRDNELAQRKMALDEQRLQFEQQQAATQAERDTADWNLAHAKDLADFHDTMSQREQALAPTLQASGNPLLGMTAQQTAANQVVRQIEQSLALGRDPGMVGGNIGSGLAVQNQGQMQDAGVKEADATRSERFAIRAEQRAEARKVREEQRAARAAQLQADAEANAAAAGKWSSTDLDKSRTAWETKLSFVPDIEKDTKRLAKLNPKDSTDILELLQKWQRKVDQGATVREGDIALIRSVNASSKDTLLADAQAFLDANKRFPAGFGEKLKNSYAGMLQAEDDKAAAIIDDFDAYAEANNWSPGQKARALPAPASVQKVRERVAARSQKAPGIDFGIKPPAGFLPHPTIPGLWVNKAGEGWKP